KWMLENNVPENKIHLIPCGVPVDDFELKERKPKSPVKIIAVSRLVEKKGMEYTIKAFNLACQKVDAVLEIIGDGPLKNDLEALAQKSDYRSQIIFHGEMNIEQVKQKLYEADIFAQHSVTATDGDTEGSPVAIAEASAAGLPIISTFHAGIPDLVENNVSGYLVKEKDYNAMAEKIIILAENFDLQRKMGATGRERMENLFNSVDQIKKLEKVLMEIFNK
ncbi:MAG: glycosyltransferase, partial [Halanaerobiales bacterium]|nr:glycosyltransferase [Halanaerobiales bacterium]